MSAHGLGIFLENKWGSKMRESLCTGKVSIDLHFSWFLAVFQYLGL
jgi:hypothetical protein